MGSSLRKPLSFPSGVLAVQLPPWANDVVSAEPVELGTPDHVRGGIVEALGTSSSFYAQSPEESMPPTF